MRQSLWPDSTAEEVDSLLRDPTAPDRATLVMERPDGTLGAFAEIATRAYAEGCASSPVAYLEGIWVDADLRRMGVARQLVEAGEVWAIGAGLAEMASDAALENLESQAFHERCGFEEVERTVCYRKGLGPGLNNSA